MLRGSSLAPSFSRTFPLLSYFTKTRLSQHHNCFRLLNHHAYFLGESQKSTRTCFEMNKKFRFCTLTVSVASPIQNSPHVSNNVKRKQRRESPEGVLKFKLDECSKHGKLVEALYLYDEARDKGVHLNAHHYNVVLYLLSQYGCSSEPGGNGSSSDISCLGFKRGFEVFKQMLLSKVTPNEATFTSAARLASAMNDPEMAFDLVKQMKSSGIPPKLRSYGPALLGFCTKREADKAYEVDKHMVESGIITEEPELSALLKVSIETKNADKVYEMLHRLRATVRQVTESTLEVINSWFKTETASEIGVRNWDVRMVNEGVVKGGGGWHGQGWLGSGEWRLNKTLVDGDGVCQSCGEKLVSVDIDPKETENFANSLISLACKREAKEDFLRFQQWLKRNGPFDAVIDGANIGMVNSNHFNFHVLKNVINKAREMSPSKRFPLVVLHKNRVSGGQAQNHRFNLLLQTWKDADALYSTPYGSNDDWYWLYAAISCKCLLVTNDEMRDHLFQLLGSSFFPRWKEKHQVRLSTSTEGVFLHPPPPYSIVIQESNQGSWHVPTIMSDMDNPRLWLCACRPKKSS